MQDYSADTMPTSDGGGTERSAIARAGRRQRRTVAIMFISGLVVLAISMAALASMSDSIGITDVSDVIFLGIWLLFAAAMIVNGVRLHRWWKRAEALVPARDGMVCPKCVLAVEAPADGAAHRRCGKCGRRYEPAALRQYWNMFVSKPTEATRFLAQALASDNTRGGKATKLFYSALGDYRVMIVYMLVIWIGVSWGTGSVGGRGLLGGMTTYLPLMLMILGFSVLGAGWKYRKGTESRCAQCGYDRMPDSGALAQEKCPECAAAWNQVGGVTHGELRRRPGLMLAGACCALVGAFLMSSRFTLGFDALSKAMPTPLLIDQIAGSADFTRSKWPELMLRTLTDAEVAALANGILDRRLLDGYIWGEDDNWLVAQITAGTLPSDIIARYYAEAIDVTLQAPAKARVGEPVDVWIEGTYRSALSANPSARLLVGGFFVGDDPEPRARSTELVSGYQLGTSTTPRPANARPAPRPGVPRVQVTPDTPGPLRVRFEYRVVYYPVNVVATVLWDDDGAPTTSAAPVWMEQRVIEHVIDVSR